MLCQWLLVVHWMLDLGFQGGLSVPWLLVQCDVRQLVVWSGLLGCLVLCMFPCHSDMCVFRVPEEYCYLYLDCGVFLKTGILPLLMVENYALW